MRIGPTNPDRTDARLTLTTLGDARLCVLGGPECVAPILEIGKPLALIVYLACTPDRKPVPRDQVIDLLWADLEPDAARHALRQTLWHIKRRVSDSLLISSSESIELKPCVETDRELFLDASTRGDLERVVQLYAGDFLPRFASPGGAEFEKWADAERRHLRSIFNRSADTLVRRRLALGRFKDAQSLATRMRELEPTNEASCRLLLESLIAGSDQFAAAIEADKIEQVFIREEQEPEPATRFLLRLARQPAEKSNPADVSQTFVTQLIGREREFAMIVESWDSVRAGSSAHVHVLSPPGLGKTRLLRDVQGRLRAMRGRVVHARATIGSREIPYSLVSDLAASLAMLRGAAGISSDSAATLVALNPTLSSNFNVGSDHSTGDDALRRRSIALVDLLRAVAEQQPVAILIDDLHWADPCSRKLLGTLVSSLSDQRVLFLTASRPVADVTLDSGRTLRLMLPPLKEQEVAELLAGLCALPNAAWASWFPRALTDATHGVPLMILETLHLLVERGLLRREDNEWHLSDETALRDALHSGGALTHRVSLLTDSEKRHLRLLAVAGGPIDVSVLASADLRTTEESRSGLTNLETRGFVTRTGELWQIAHDEIARTIQDISTAEEVERAERIVGDSLWEHAGNDLATIRRSARHFSRGRRQPSLRLAFARFMRLLREDGDRRDFREIAEDFLGDDRSELEARALVEGLPLHMRLGLDTRQRRVSFALAAAVIPALVAVTIPLVRGPALGPPDAELVVIQQNKGEFSEGIALPIRLGDWVAGRPLNIPSHGRSVLRVASDAASAPTAARPGGQDWILSLPVADTGAIDLFHADADGKLRRLTYTKGDEQAPSWSPDGKYAAMTSSQWTKYGRYDVAVIDVSNEKVRQLTSGEDSDTDPMWSPDGTRIAFIRRYWITGSDSLCSVWIDGSRTECSTSFAGAPANVVGWLDAERILVTIRREKRTALLSVHWKSGAEEPIAAGVIDKVTVSQDGRWIACFCALSGMSSEAWIVFPTADPGRARPLLADGQPLLKSASSAWRLPAQRYLATLSIRTTPREIQVGVPDKLFLIAKDDKGSAIVPVATTWSVDDSTIATIGSDDGVLYPLRPGTVMVIANAGGWRQAHVAVSVRPRAKDSVLLRENWIEELEKRWYVFGDPRPSIDSLNHFRGLANNGDQNFASGVHTRQAFSMIDGLALDAVLFAPITLAQWQSVNLGFAAGLDTNRATSTLRANGVFEKWAMRQPYVCTLSYPGGHEGPAYADSISLIAGGERRTVAVPTWLLTRQPFRVRLQQLPDGRCAVAIEGRPIYVGPAPTINADSASIVLWGMSVETRVLVGPLKLRMGVPGDIDWSAFDQSRAARNLRRSRSIRP